MGGIRNTMSHSSSQKYKAQVKPSCLPGASHHWVLEPAQKTADEGPAGTSSGACVRCGATYTFVNSVMITKVVWGRPTAYWPPA